MLNSLSFCLSVKLLISPSSLNEILAFSTFTVCAWAWFLVRDLRSCKVCGTARFFFFFKATDFCTLTLYSATLLNLFIGSNSFLVDTLEFPICNIVSFANSDSFASSLPVRMHFVYFSWLLPWLGVSVLCWVKVVRVAILVLFLNFKEVLSAFLPWILC